MLSFFNTYTDVFLKYSARRSTGLPPLFSGMESCRSTIHGAVQNPDAVKPEISTPLGGEIPNPETERSRAAENRDETKILKYFGV